MNEIVWDRIYHLDGSQPWYEIPLVNGHRHGVAKWYYKDGQLQCEIPHVNGLIYGVRKMYHEDGQLSRETPYVNHRRHGIENQYNYNGTLKEQYLYINDKIRNDLLGDEHRLTRLTLLGSEV